MVLVVDDDPHSLAALTAMLTAEGLRVRPADSGELALASIAAKQPSLILLDARMPGLDGFEVCRRLKSSAETREIPVIFMSAAADVEDKLRGLKLGAVDFVYKPFHRDEVLARVRTHLELALLRKDLERQLAEKTAELHLANCRLEEELTERRHAEKALRESEVRFRHLANRAPVGIWILGRNQRLQFYNKRTSTFAGKILAQSHGDWTELVHPEDLASAEAKYHAAVAARRAFRIECRIRCAKGRYCWALHTGIPHFIDGEFAGHIGTSIDITDIKRSHEKLLSVQKVESLGALSAGIAHDFNNVVGSIFAASDLALADLPVDAPARENIERINAVATRAAQVVNLLMAYAGGRETRVDNIDLSLVVAEMVELLKGVISPEAQLDVRLAEDLPVVRANVTQIRHVVLNLVMNASEALEGQRGTIRIVTERIYRKPGFNGYERDLPDGECCRLVVADTGCGMTPEACARAFDPFFSTKFLGRGLGLAVVQGIVRSIEGAIHVTTRPGSGSAFEILLPGVRRNRVEKMPVKAVAALQRVSSSHAS